MEIYLVGGAVRDELLGLPVKDRDWVVVGATPEQMIAEGYKQVGADFPVFLHPVSHEEYALARTERKQGHGYHGFVVHSAPDVTLEQDLLRRDLTINALARSETGALVDPFNGARDLKKQVLRHVSPAFAEDPLRVLRTARFAARLAPLGFKVAPETNEIMAGMVNSGELDHLVAERVWKELGQTLCDPSPGTFFQVLDNCGALARMFPALCHPQRLERGLAAISQLPRTSSASLRLVALLHAVPDEEADQLISTLKPPSEVQALLPLVRLLKLQAQRGGRAAELPAWRLLELLTRCDAWRRSERFDDLMLVLDALPLNEAPELANQLRRARIKSSGVETAPFLERGLRGPELGQAIHDERLRRIQQMRHS